MNPETWEEQKERLDIMSREDSTWDLSPRDCQAIKAALAKAELWDKIKGAFVPISQHGTGSYAECTWAFFGRVPAKIDEPIEDAVRRLA